MAGGVCEVIITAPDPDWLARFVHQLVNDRICASSHITSIHSVYRWQDKIYNKVEARTSVHTRTTLVAAIVDRIGTEHPYEVPCVIALPIIDGNPAYIQWILDETSNTEDT